MASKLAKAKVVMEKEGKIAKRKMDRKISQSVMGKIRTPPLLPSKHLPEPTDKGMARNGKSGQRNGKSGMKGKRKDERE